MTPANIIICDADRDRDITLSGPDLILGLHRTSFCYTIEMRRRFTLLFVTLTKGFPSPTLSLSFFLRLDKRANCFIAQIR